MSEFVATFKGGPGYDAPWLVVHCDTVSELADAIAAVEAGGVMVQIGKAAESFRNHANVGGVLGATPVAPPAYAPPVAAPAAPQGPPGQAVPTCPHGTKNYVVSKPGAAKQWKAYMCPTPQGTPGQCPPEWIN